MRQMRAKNFNTPVLLLTARGEVTAGGSLNAGLTIISPSRSRLPNWSHASGRSAAGAGNQISRSAGRRLTLDTVLHQARRGDAVIDWRRVNFGLLEYLMRCKGRVLRSHGDCRERFGITDLIPGSNLVDVTSCVCAKNRREL